MASTTAGSSQLRSGWAGSKGGGTTGPTASSKVHAGADRSKAATQLLGGRARRARPSRQTYQSRCALARPDDRASTNHGCRSEVWLGTQSMITLSPRAWASCDEPVEVLEGAEQRVDVAVVG